jgi:hypothetical protein
VVDNKLFAITCSGTLGGTFLDWSIHWLSGADKFYKLNLGWIDLVSNPLTPTNAHGHQKNHPCGSAETLAAAQDLKELQTDNLLSFYSFPINELEEDYVKLWYCLIQHSIPIIYIKLTAPIVYNTTLRSLENKSFTFNSVEELHEQFLQKHFKKDYDYWKNILKMNNIPDSREFIALNVRPHEYIDPTVAADFSKSHFYLDAQELWYNGEDALTRIMKYLDIKIQNERLISWVPIYKQWQQKQLNILKFSWNLDRICESIVKDYYYDLSEYNLGLWEEAIIQHEMIYKYGLNFKTWQLEKLPNNTQELHKLLEPNTIHQVEDIYGLLKDKQ